MTTLPPLTTIQCINHQCNTLNPIEENFCSRCSTPIVKRYLWVMGEIDNHHNIGELIDNRFFIVAKNILVDTKPKLLPPLPETIPDHIRPYLKLFSQRLHLPQIYGYLNQEKETWLLEYETTPLDAHGRLTYPQIFPTLEESWAKASPLRQLNWFWQIIHLWLPLNKHKMLSSLFIAQNIRVNGSIIKLMELKSDDEDRVPTLHDLGNLLSPLVTDVNDLIKEIFTNIILSLQQKLLTNPKEVLDILDQTLFILGNDYYSRQYEIITATNVGHKRKNNEDACYPTPTEVKSTSAGIETLTIICDGLGGQKSGEIASHLAIEVLQKQLSESYQKQLKDTLNNKNWTPLIDKEKILIALSKANNEIAKINNEEKRKDRDRMGTTVVMSLGLDHEMYLAHVGDSRIYWVNREGCHQVTVDDDLASREVRLGYGFYREITKNPQSGALIQALGTDSARNIRPHIKRLIPDEDCIFLLCSDGLSDFERVEQYWRSEVSPILTKQKTISESIDSLLNIALAKNGHDNITIGLVYHQLKWDLAEHKRDLSWETLKEILPHLPQPIVSTDSTESHSTSLLKNKYIIFLLSVFVILTGFFIFYRLKSSEDSSFRIWYSTSVQDKKTEKGVVI